jgi:hypothetical protein
MRKKDKLQGENKVTLNFSDLSVHLFSLRACYWKDRNKIIILKKDETYFRLIINCVQVCNLV